MIKSDNSQFATSTQSHIGLDAECSNNIERFVLFSERHFDDKTLQ